MSTRAPERRRRRQPGESDDLAVGVDDISEGDATAFPTAPSAVPPAPRKGRRGSPIAMVRGVMDVAGPAGLAPVLLLMGISAVERFDASALGILAPDIRDAFHLSNSAFVPITTLTGLLPLLLSVPLGVWSDRTNRVRLAWIGAIVWGVTCIGVGLAPTILIFAFMRFAGGSGQLVNEVTHPSLLSDYYPPEALAPVFSFYGVAAGAIGLVAGPLAGTLGDQLGWRPTFIVLAVPTLIFAFVVAARLREPQRGQSLGLVANDGDKPGLAESFRRLKAVRSLKRTWYAAFFFGGGVASFAAYLSLFFHDVYHVSDSTRGLISVVFGVIGLGGLAVGGRLVQQQVMADKPERLPIINGLLVLEFAGGVALMAIAPNFILSLGAVCVLSIGFAGYLPAYRTLVALVVDARLRSQAFAWTLIWFLLGAILVSGVIGSVGDAHGQRVALFVLAALVGLGGSIALTAARFVRRDVENARTIKQAVETDALLTIRGLDAGYGQTQILFKVDFEVHQGEIVALLGTNGAGKSTLLKAISGIIEPLAGAVVFDGIEVTNADAIHTAHAGVAQVPGGRGIFPSLSVAENLRAAGWMFRKDKAYFDEAIKRVLDYFPILERRWDTAAGSLSGGEQQMLSLAQAFIAKPKLLMIDELSLGLAPTIVERLLDIVRAIHDQGTTIILVEQSVNVALRLAKRAVFMEKGEIRFSGATEELLHRPDILRSVFLEGAQAGLGASGESAPAGGNGKALDRRADEARRADLLRQPVVLEVRDITKRYGGVTAVNEVNFELHEGQILGLIGPNGAGKTTIFDLISGFSTLDGGRVLLEGVDVTDWPAHRRAIAGLGRSFQDARLWPSLTVKEAIAAAMTQTVEITNPLPAAFGLPSAADSEARVMRKVEELIALLGLGAFRDKFISELSTGSRRMVEIATLIANEPRIIILDEPSSGIAQKETEALGPMLKEVQRYTNCSILVIEHDMPLLSGLADHVVGLELGAVIAFGTPTEVLNHPRVIESYLGTATYAQLEEEVETGEAIAAGSTTTGTTRRARRNGGNTTS